MCYATLLPPPPPPPPANLGVTFPLLLRLGNRILAGGLPAVGLAIAGFALLTIPADEARAHDDDQARFHFQIGYPLHGAAAAGNVYFVNHFLAAPHGKDVNERRDGLRTPLHAAAGASSSNPPPTENSRVSVVLTLLAKGAEVNAKDSSGWTPLHHAAVGGYVSIIAALVAEEKTEVDLKDNFGVTPLYWVAGSGYYDGVVALIAAGADVTLTNNNGETPLHWAARSGRHDIVVVLAAAGADVNATDNSGKTPLHNAAQMGNSSVVRSLILLGGRYNNACLNGFVVNPAGDSPPCVCPANKIAADGACEIVAVCTSPSTRNADTNGCDCPAPNVGMDGAAEPGVCAAASADSCGGLTPPAFYSPTLSACAPYDACLAAGDCALSAAACARGFSPEQFYDSAAGECVAVAECAAPAVLNAGTNRCDCPSPNIGADRAAAPGDCHPENALHAAAGAGDLVSVNYLIAAHMADVNATVSGETPLHAAAGSGHVSVVLTLLAKGAEVNAKDNGGLTPLRWADFREHSAVVAALLAAGGHYGEACMNPAVANPAGPNPSCVCQSPNVGTPENCAAPGAQSCGTLNPAKFYDSAAGECVAVAVCAAPAVLNMGTNRCECAGAAVLDGAGTGCLCEPPNVGTPESCVAASADSCRGLTPAKLYDPAAGACVAPGADSCRELTPLGFYDSAAELCVAVAVCAAPAVLNAGTNRCNCPDGYSGDGAACQADKTVSFSSPANGTLSADSGGVAVQDGDTVIHGATVTFTAEAAKGYEVSIWTGGCAGATGVSCEAVATLDVRAGVVFFEAGAESCGRLSPARFYDSAARECVAVATCTAPAVWDAGTNRCNCPAPNIGTDGAAAPGDCAVPVPSAEVCGGLTPSQFYDSAADKCVAASVEVCEELIPAKFYDSTARECVAAAKCDLPSVRNAGTNRCDCPPPNIGEDGAVAPGDCAAPGVEVCRGLTPEQFYAVTLFYGATLSACVPVANCQAGATLNRAANLCECAGAAVLDGAGTGCLCEPPNVGTPGDCAAPGAQSCGTLNPAKFYDSAANECVAVATCAAPAVLNAGTNRCDCPAPNIGTDGADAPGDCVAASAESCKGLSPPAFYDSAAGECVAVATCAAPAVLNAGTNRCDCPAPNIGTDGANAPGSCHPENALHAAAGAGDLVSVNYLIAARMADVNATVSGVGETPLHAAAGNGHVSVVLMLLAEGANANAKSDNVRTPGWTPLHYAAGNGHVSVVLTLLAMGAEVNARDNGGLTPLRWADVRHRTAKTAAAGGGLTPLGWADVREYSAIVAALLAAGGHYGEACASPAVVNPAGPNPSCVCQSPNVERNGVCLPEFGDLGVLSHDSLCGAFGGTVRMAAGGEVCSGMDANNTFCIIDSVDGFPCRGLFKHVWTCNVRHNRPALNPFFCGEPCGAKNAVGKECKGP